MRVQSDELREVIGSGRIHARCHRLDPAHAAVIRGAPSVLVVDIDHHGPRHIREHSLCEVVLLHRAVVVEVILR